MISQLSHLLLYHLLLISRYASLIHRSGGEIGHTCHDHDISRLRQLQSTTDCICPVLHLLIYKILVTCHVSLYTLLHLLHNLHPILVIVFVLSHDHYITQLCRDSTHFWSFALVTISRRTKHRYQSLVSHSSRCSVYCLQRIRCHRKIYHRRDTLLRMYQLLSPRQSPIGL